MVVASFEIILNHIFFYSSVDTNEKLKIELLRESNEAISDEIAANKSRCLRILEEWPELAKIYAVPI